ncbi:MAG: hypothetical protein IJT16_13440 [Lachnospiraceae bacterium]|nr:hypothetical protein [Lachnospiraceae bacterium]
MKGDLPKKRHISVPFLLLLTLAVLMIVLFPAGYIMSEKVSPSESITLRIAIPYSDTVQDPDSNYYVKWLAERTGLSLEFTLIRQNRSEEYLDALFS